MWNVHSPIKEVLVEALVATQTEIKLEQFGMASERFPLKADTGTNQCEALTTITNNLATTATPSQD
jgi:hypothetical protein